MFRTFFLLLIYPLWSSVGFSVFTSFWFSAGFFTNQWWNKLVSCLDPYPTVGFVCGCWWNFGFVCGFCSILINANLFDWVRSNEYMCTTCSVKSLICQAFNGSINCLTSQLLVGTKTFFRSCLSLYKLQPFYQSLLILNIQTHWCGHSPLQADLQQNQQTLSCVRMILSRFNLSLSMLDIGYLYGNFHSIQFAALT